MKKFVYIALLLGCLLCLTACGERQSSSTEPEESTAISDRSTQEPELPSESGTAGDGIRVRLAFEGGEAIMCLENNAAARALAEQFPLTQTFEDFNSIEKICRLPEDVATEGVETGVDPDIADVTLYVPWNTLVFYYDDYGYNDELIPIGYVESGMELLAGMGDEFSVTMELLEDNEEGGSEMEQVAEHTEITMTVGDTIITAALDNSETTQAFLATLPRTLTMNRYGNREYYGRIEAISENGEAIADFEDGDVTYYPAGPSFAVFFAGEDSSTQSGLIRMGKVTSDLSLFENLGGTAEMRIEVISSNE